MLADLLELFPAGVEEDTAGEDVVYAVYGAPGELPELPELRATAGGALVDVTTSEVADDWAERWRAFHKPLTIAGRVHVRPPWSPSPGPELVDVVIDPGRAFGTGAHPTTKLSLELLVESVPAGGGLADYGAGSGVLAIAAAKLGFAPVLAIDNDPLAVDAAQGNAVANGVELEARRVDLRSGPLPAAPTIVANLLRPLLLALAERLPDPAPRALIASGLLPEEADEVAAAFAARGLPERARRVERGWAALALGHEK